MAVLYLTSHVGTLIFCILGFLSYVCACVEWAPYIDNPVLMTYPGSLTTKSLGEPTVVYEFTVQYTDINKMNMFMIFCPSKSYYFSKKRRRTYLE